MRNQLAENEHDRMIGMTMAVGMVDCIYAFLRDGVVSTVIGAFGKKIHIVPVVFGNDGEYHITQKSLSRDKKVPREMGVKIVGTVSIC